MNNLTDQNKNSHIHTYIFLAGQTKKTKDIIVGDSSNSKDLFVTAKICY